MKPKTLFSPDLTLEDAKELIENGADVNSINTIGLTPLHFLENIDIARLLIDNGADVNKRDATGQTPLFYAESIEIVELLIQHKANVNEESHEKITPLFYSETIEIAKLLIAHGADVNHRDYNHHSILYNTNHQFAGLFISAGAIPSEITTYHQLRHLFSEEQREAFDMFITITSDDNDFFQMCLAYQNDKKNNVKIDIKDMDIQ